MSKKKACSQAERTWKMDDKTRWLAWFKHSHTSTYTNEELLEAYDVYYTCQCESCNTRKSMGLMPINQGETCTTPIDPLNLDRVQELRGLPQGGGVSTPHPE